MENPSYYSILTSEIRYNKNLTDSEKLLYSEITALTQKNGECWATNEYFAELYNVRPETISRRISKLKKLGFIDTKIVYKQDSKQIEKRIIRISSESREIQVSLFDNNQKEEEISKPKEEPFFYEYDPNDEEHPFNIFWSIYPRKEKKNVSMRIFKRKVKNRLLFSKIYQDISLRKSTDQWIRDGGSYIPHPSTYLNSELWEDKLFEIQQ